MKKIDFHLKDNDMRFLSFCIFTLFFLCGTPQFFCLKAMTQKTTNNNLVEAAKTSFDVVIEQGNITTQINPNELTELPIGLIENKNSVEYGIVVTKVVFTPTYALIDAFARIRTPQHGVSGGKMDLYFGAEGIKLSYGGQIIGDAKLSLLGNDIQMPFNNNKWMLTLEAGNINNSTGNVEDSNTYVVIDCKGIKELSLKGNVQISRDVLLPLDLTTGKIAPEMKQQGEKVVKNRVRGDFLIKAIDWNDLLVKVNLTPFAIKAQAQNSDKGYFSFLVNEAVLDLSDLRNDPAVVFPKYYLDNGYLIAGEESWRGLFVQSLEIGLPEEFKTSDNPNDIIRLGAKNLIIDNYGVSGHFAAENLFSIEKGITSKDNGWSYSLDEIGVELAASHIVGANIAGEIILPIQDNTSKAKNLIYEGIITEEEYLLSVGIRNTIDFNIWSAKASINEGSAIELKVKNKKFYPKAILNGTLDISASRKVEDNQKKLLSFKDIKFEGLTLQNQAPFIAVNHLEVRGQQKLATFPVSVNDITVHTDNNRADLGFGITVGLQDKGFAASGRLTIKGEVKSDNHRQKWKYTGVDISRLALENVDVGVAVVSGELEMMNNDPLYGDGFRAFLNAKIKTLSDVNVKVDAIFGYSTFRYWGFEGSVSGLNIPTSVIDINGFTGGAFYHMLPDQKLTMDERYKNKALVFIPDEKIGLALRAGVYGSIKDKKVASLMAGFNISTNANGGLANVGFVGEAYVMSELTAIVPNPIQKVQEKFKGMVGKSKFINDLAKNNRLNKVLDVRNVDEYYPTSITVGSTAKQPAITAKVALNYDFNNNIFHGDLDVYVNTPGNFITGTGRNGRAGWAVLHIAPEDWYLHIGTPTDMIGLKVGIGSFYVESGSYFMVGSQIPGSPPPPVEVANILGLQLNDIDYMKNLNSLADGKGFAFGSHFKFDTGDMTALFLYARFNAGLGTDIMLKNYGQAACSNRSGEQIGINGWYANGQAYAYLQGELGIKIKLFFIKKKIPIIKAGAAALLQAKGPNPFWIRGYLGGYYNLLGGLVKGKYRFKLEFGEECKLENESVLGGMKIIADVTPQENTDAIDVFAIPQATFAFTVNQPIVIPEDDGDHTYKIMVDKFTVVDEQGKEIEGEIEYGASGDVASFISSDILPPNKKLKTIVKVSFLEKKNGLYEVLTVAGKKATEIEERNFVTGTAPSTIPLRNVLYAYPVIEQNNYYRKEANKGYIKLKRGQDYLFDDSNWKTSVIFDTNGKETITDFSYDTNSNEVNFTVPSLQKTTDYTLKIIAKNEKENTNTPDFIENNKEESNGKDASLATATIVKKAAQTISKEGNIERINYTFRTSRHNTFAEKIKSLHFTPNKGYISTGLYFLQNKMKAKEYFDIPELVGSKYTDGKPLIEVTALMNDKFSEKFKNLFYDKYPVDGILINREGNNATVGIPPSNALPIITSYLTYLDKEKWNMRLKELFPYRYDLFRHYSNDWYQMVAKAANKYIHTDFANMPKEIQNIISSQFGVIPKGKYSVKLEYIMPGNKKGTTAVLNYEMKKGN